MDWVWWIFKVWGFLACFGMLISFCGWSCMYGIVTFFQLFRNPIKIWEEYRSQNKTGIFKLFKDIIFTIFRYPLLLWCSMFLVVSAYILFIMFFNIICSWFGFEHLFEYLFNILEYLGLAEYYSFDN